MALPQLWTVFLYFHCHYLQLWNMSSETLGHFVHSLLRSSVLEVSLQLSWLCQRDRHDSTDLIVLFLSLVQLSFGWICNYTFLSCKKLVNFSNQPGFTKLDAINIPRSKTSVLILKCALMNELYQIFSLEEKKHQQTAVSGSTMCPVEACYWVSFITN